MSALLWAAVAPVLALGQAGPDAAKIEDLMARARVPGLALASVDGAEPPQVVLLGVANAESGAPVTAETLFEAASLSKPVFATAVLRLAERGELDLDQPLHELLSNERISHDPRSKLLTARLVLSHRSGLPNWGPEKLRFQRDPGGEFGYSGEGYVYLQQVLEKVTGLPLDALVRREVFAPLGMERSRFSWPEGSELPLAQPHGPKGYVLPKRPAHEANAAASLHTTAAEYARFVAAWLQGELLDPETRVEALRPASFMTQGPGMMRQEGVWDRLAWALGWGVQLDSNSAEARRGEGDPIYFHWGDNGPFKAFVAFRPSTGRSLVYFANGMHGLALGPDLVRAHVGDMGVTFEGLGYPLLNELEQRETEP